MQLIGQEKIKKQINNFTKERSPRFILITGNRHSGRTQACKLIAQKLELDLVYMDNAVDSIRSLVSTQKKVSNCLFVFKDFNSASKEAVGSLLKLAEETPNDCYIAVTMSGTPLDTLSSRAYTIRIEGYSSEEIYKYAKTVSKLSELSLLEIEKYISIGWDTPSKLFHNYDPSIMKIVSCWVPQAASYLVDGSMDVFGGYELVVQLKNLLKETTQDLNNQIVETLNALQSELLGKPNTFEIINTISFYKDKYLDNRNLKSFHCITDLLLNT